MRPIGNAAAAALRMLACYFSSVAVDVAGPSPMIKSTASSSLAPSQCTCLPAANWSAPASSSLHCVHASRSHSRGARRV